MRMESDSSGQLVDVAAIDNAVPVVVGVCFELLEPLIEANTNCHLRYSTHFRSFTRSLSSSQLKSTQAAPLGVVFSDQL